MCARIFIVEDEQIISADLEAKLTRMGHRVVGAAASGREALRLVEQLHTGLNAPDLVLMDIRLQGDMDGIEAARCIHALAGIQVVFITAYGEMLLSNPALMVPPAVCLTKPFSLYQLRQVIDAVLGSETRPG